MWCSVIRGCPSFLFNLLSFLKCWSKASTPIIAQSIKLFHIWGVSRRFYIRIPITIFTCLLFTTPSFFWPISTCPLQVPTFSPFCDSIQSSNDTRIVLPISSWAEPFSYMPPPSFFPRGVLSCRLGSWPGLNGAHMNYKHHLILKEWLPPPQCCQRHKKLMWHHCPG